MKRNAVLIFLIFFIFSCQEKNDSPLLKSLKEIESSWTNKQLSEFANKPDSIALSDLHFSYGMYFRNHHIRNPKDSSLVKYFHSLNIYHEDYMSSIVFTSLHRELNNEPIDLEGQLKTIHKEMEKVKKLKNKNTLRAKRYLENYRIGDTILIRRPIDEGRNAVQYSYPEDSEWVYNDSLDLIIKGIIEGKDETKDSLDVFFKVKVLSLSNEKVKVLMEDVKVNDTIQVDLRLDIIENIEK